MENISEAVYMGGAALLFIVAFTITLMLFGQAKNTTDAGLAAADKSSYYQQIQPNKTGVTRKVGIETVIPTIYRYFQEGFTVRICKRDGNVEKELQVFDSTIEGRIANDPNNNSGSRDLEKYVDTSSAVYMYGAPWGNGDTNYSNTLKRINAYIYGEDITIGTSEIQYKSKNNYLMNDEDKTFEESYLEYNTSGRYKADGFGNWYSIIDGGKKVIVTYTVQ